jgi:hypothetical protein
LKKGKYGYYAAWGTNTKSLKTLGNRPIENITREDILAAMENNKSGMVRPLSDDLSIRKSKRGDYIFYKTPKMKKQNEIVNII